MAKNNILTKEQLQKKKSRDVILAPIYIYIIAAIISMLAFPTGLKNDTLYSSIIFALVGSFFFLGGVMGLKSSKKILLIQIYYIIVGILGYLFIVSWFFEHNSF